MDYERFEAAREKRARRLAKFTESDSAKLAPDRVRLAQKTTGIQEPIPTPEIQPE